MTSIFDRMRQHDVIALTGEGVFVQHTPSDHKHGVTEMPRIGGSQSSSSTSSPAAGAEVV